MDSATIANQLATYDASRKSSADVLNAAMSQYGVPEIRTRVAGLRTTLSNTEGALNNVDPSVTGRTSQSLVTEAQRQRMVANERAPIAQQYSSQANALSNESANLSDQEKAAQTLADNQNNDYTVGRAALQSNYDTTYKREQDAASAQQAAAQLAEQQRQFNVSASQKSGGTAAAASPAQVKLQVSQHVAQQLAGNTGKDGYVSNETWSAALNDFVSGGGNTREFFQKYSQFVNPKYKASYAGWANR